MKKIDKKIVGYAVNQSSKNSEKKKSSPINLSKDDRAEVIRMHEKLERPEILVGSTYKVKTPISDHAMYVTINDIVLNQNTDDEKRRPFEIFINSKNLDHYQWIVALTRVISAVFRKGGDVTFLVDELKAVFDPRGGYWQPGGKFMPSIIAELGYIVEKHLISIGLLTTTELDEHQKELLEKKREEYENAKKQQDAFSTPPSGIHKIVLATNIAETGVTIPDVVFVIDTCLVKETRFNEHTRIRGLVQCYIPQSSGKQRRGRAGRVREGFCFRLIYFS